MTDAAPPEGLVERCLGAVPMERCPDYYTDEGCDGLEGCADCMRLTLRAVLAVAAPALREQCAQVCVQFAEVAAEIGDDPEWVARRCAENIRRLP